MRKICRCLTFAVSIGVLSQTFVLGNASESHTLESPDGKLRVAIWLDNRGRPVFHGAQLDVSLVTGTLGLELADTGRLVDNFRITDVRRESRDDTYSIPIGKADSARDHHNELVVSLTEKQPPHRQIDLVFRAFDDGVAFRYELPVQSAISEFVLTDEHTQLDFPADPLAHLLPLNGYTTSYEKYYKSQRVSAIDPATLIGLPMLIERTAKDDGARWLAVTEANLTDYAGLYLAAANGGDSKISARLSPLPEREDGAKVIGKVPFVSPWRVIMIADNPGEFIESNLIFNLSEPSAIEDTAWIKPGPTTFPWWNGYALEGVDFKPGVNTATMKYYIDFCAEQGIPYHSLDGLDIAWYGGPIHVKGPTDVTTAAPSIDLPEVLRYAKDKGVRLRLWMHWKALKPQIDEAFRMYEQWGIEGVMVDFMDRDDQDMVRFYHEMAEKAAKHHLTLTLHGAYKPTGMERTWPNVLSYEAALNQEYNKWDRVGTPPEHNLNVAFIRMLAGPVDYHQGGMRSILPEDHRPRSKAPRVQGTRGHQLAMYVVYLNHLPMLADYPAAYRGQPGLEFLTAIPSTWDETRVLQAEFGECLVVARRNGHDWFIGGMTAAEPKKLNLKLGFLGEGSFQAESLMDHPSDGPTALERSEHTVSRADTLQVAMPRAGGFVARLSPQ